MLTKCCLFVCHTCISKGKTLVMQLWTIYSRSQKDSTIKQIQNGKILLFVMKKYTHRVNLVFCVLRINLSLGFNLHQWSGPTPQGDTGCTCPAPVIFRIESPLFNPRFVLARFLNTHITPILYHTVLNYHWKINTSIWLGKPIFFVIS